MQIAYLLLISALQLKMALLGLSSQYADFVNQNMPIVDSAISIAQSEINKPIPVAPVVTVQTQPVVEVPTFGAVVVQAPTCTLTASSTQLNSDTITTSIAWTSTNATSAIAYVDGPVDGGNIIWKYPTTLAPNEYYIKGEKVIFNVDSGYRAGFNARTVKVQFTGPGGNTSCIASI